MSGASNPKPPAPGRETFSPEGRDPTDRGARASTPPCARSTWCKAELGHDGDCVLVNRPPPVRVRFDLAGYFGAPRKDP